jgi:hypothetical protein
VAMYEHGPHTVTIYLEETYTDSYGAERRRPSETPVVVSGAYMHPVSSARGAFAAVDVRAGQRVDASWKLVCRADAPLGWWSRVEWRGKTFSILGGPLLRQSSPSTTHISCTLQEER